MTNELNSKLRFQLPGIYQKKVEPTGDVVMQFIEDHQKYLPRYQELEAYYRTYAKILDRPDKEDHKANNKLVHPYPSYIVDVILGMFVGKPIKFSVSQEEQDAMGLLQMVFDENDEQDENNELAKMCGIKGRGYEVVYLDEDSNIKFNELEPDNIIMNYDNTINPEPLFAIRYYKGTNEEDIFAADGPLIAEVYTRNEIIEYKEVDDAFEEQTRSPHFFGEVPIIEYMNNKEGIGDFERVLPLIDAYNKSQSDTANDFEEFTDALLILYGMLNTDDKDVAQMMEDRVLPLDNVDGNQGAEWLIKEINDAALENYKNRLDNDIHKFSLVPNMSDEQFASNASGVAMAYKLLGLLQIISSKQRGFKRALQKRLRLITTILSMKKEDGLDYRDIDIQFTTNLPVNDKELVEIAQILKGMVSRPTWLSILPFIDDVNEEIERIDEEIDGYGIDDVIDEVEKELEVSDENEED